MRWWGGEGYDCRRSFRRVEALEAAQWLTQFSRAKRYWFFFWIQEVSRVDRRRRWGTLFSRAKEVLRVERQRRRVTRLGVRWLPAWLEKTRDGWLEKTMVFFWRNVGSRAETTFIVQAYIVNWLCSCSPPRSHKRINLIQNDGGVTNKRRQMGA
jgi:hypothetical protein